MSKSKDTIVEGSPSLLYCIFKNNLNAFFHNYEVKEDAVVVEKGVLSDKTKEIGIERIESVDKKQYYIESTINVGTVKISDRSGNTELNGIKNYEKFYQEISKRAGRKSENSKTVSKNLLDSIMNEKQKEELLEELNKSRKKLEEVRRKTNNYNK